MGGLAAVMLMYSTAANAQEQTSAAASTSGAADSTAIAPVTVTARLRPESEERVPLSMAVVGGETLQKEGRFEIGDLDSRVANLQLGDLNGTPTVFMRGVGGGGRNVAFEPRTGIYLDGVFMNDPPLTDALMLDLERVEVLRGPQGSLFGQNTDSGAISLVTRQPGERLAAESLVRADNRHQYRMLDAVDVPLVDNRLLLRLSANLAQSDGFVTNLFDGSRPDGYKEAGGRLRLQWRIAPGLRDDLAADGARHADEFPTGEAFTNTSGKLPNGLPPFTVDVNTRQVDARNSNGTANTLTWDSSIGTLTSITAWRGAKRHWLVDLDYSPADGFTQDYTDRYHRLSQELRLTSIPSASPITWIGGLYIFREQADSFRPVIGGPDIAAFVPSLKPGDTLTVTPSLNTLSFAAFGDLGYSLRPGLRLDAGLRLVTSHRKFIYSQQSTGGFTGAYPQIDGFRTQLTEKAALPDVALSWDVNPAMTSYLRYARGAKPGGFNADVLQLPLNTPSPFSVETVNTYEVGLKSHWQERRVRANLAVFLSDYNDYQVSQFQMINGFFLPVIGNAGKVRSYGPELELQALPLRGLSVHTSAAWLHAEYTSFPNGGGAGVDFTHHRTEFSPKWTVDSAIDYRRPVQWGAIGGVDGEVSYSWRTQFFTAPSNAPQFLVGPRYLLGARLGVHDVSDRVELSVFADNLLNDIYLNTTNRGTLGTYYGRYGAPRTLGVQLQLNFE